MSSRTCSPQSKTVRRIMDYIDYMFYDASVPGAKKGLAHSAIQLVSDPYIHVELRFSDGMSFSAEYGVGVRKKDIQYSHPERWKKIRIHYPAAMVRHMRYAAETLVLLQLEYDLRGAAGCAFTGKEDPWDYFCSEFVYDVTGGHIVTPKINHKMHPTKLYEVAQAMQQAAVMIYGEYQGV
jgi:hypothetical protein